MRIKTALATTAATVIGALALAVPAGAQEPIQPGPEFDPANYDCKVVLGLVPTCRLKDEFREDDDVPVLGPVISGRLIYDALPGEPE